MGARWLYMLPALILSAVAVILALIGLAREPAPSSESDSSEGMVMQVTEEQAREALEHNYWVSTRELNVGDTIGEDDFRKVGVSVPLAQAVEADTEITDKLLRRNVREGEVLSQSHLKAGNRLAQGVPAGFRAFAIGIGNTSAVGGLLKPGDLVDVLAHFSSGEDGEPTAMFVLNGIEVLAVKGRLQEPAPDEEERRSRNNTAVLAIPREDLPRLLLADHNGDLRLAMAGAAQEKHDDDEDGDGDNSEGENQQDAVASQAEDDDALSLTTKLETLFPEKKKVKQRRAAPRGEKVEVYEGSNSRSTYVH